MKPKVYIETTVVSYLTARPSRDLVVAGHQQLTRDWWEQRSDDFELFVSKPVIDEVSAGDEQAARRRVELLAAVPRLMLTQEVMNLARAFVDQGTIPEKAAIDALHIAVATVHGVDYLLTWNCTHIANAEIRGRIEELSRRAGYEPPIICTPEELMGE